MWCFKTCGAVTLPKASGGPFFVHEADDGYDTVEWAARLPNSNGKVGMFGASYVGLTQWMAARRAPPSLKALVPAVTFADVADGFIMRDGVFELGLTTDWQLNAIGLETLRRRHENSHPEVRVKAETDLLATIDTLPSGGYFNTTGDIFANHGLAPGIVELLATRNVPYAWSPFSYREAYQDVNVPACIVGGWYDIFLQGTLDTFQNLTAANSPELARHSKLIVGPWSHTNFSSCIGEKDFGLEASLSRIATQGDLTTLTQRWFDYWLKDIANGVAEEPPVKLFVTGTNTWRHTEAWPPARIAFTPYYARIGGLLSAAMPHNEPPDTYAYDPSLPVPTLGGAIMMHPTYPAGVKNQAELETRADVLTFTSEISCQDVEVIGPVKVKLWATSDAPNVDFVVRLIDVHPDGFAQNLTDGIVRASTFCRKTQQRFEVGCPYLFAIDLWSTANVFRAGHRICLHVTSGSFPRWERNLPHGDKGLRKTLQTVFHDADRPSHVLLPIKLPPNENGY